MNIFLRFVFQLNYILEKVNNIQSPPLHLATHEAAILATHAF
jgi:hypothetical protein